MWVEAKSLGTERDSIGWAAKALPANVRFLMILADATKSIAQEIDDKLSFKRADVFLRFQSPLSELLHS